MPRRKPKTPGVQPSRDVSAAARAITALDLAIAGHDWQTIAQRAGYGSKGAAHNAVQRELDRIIVPKVETLRTMHHLRLQRLRTVYLPKALSGDGWSADRVIRFDEREAALLGLDTKAGEIAANAPYTKRVVLCDDDATAAIVQSQEIAE